MVVAVGGAVERELVVVLDGAELAVQFVLLLRGRAVESQACREASWDP